MIKDKSELASLLGAAFTNYANRVLNGRVEPYMPFLEGYKSVEVTVSLVGDQVEVKEIVPVAITIKEPPKDIITSPITNDVAVMMLKPPQEIVPTIVETLAPEQPIEEPTPKPTRRKKTE